MIILEDVSKIFGTGTVGLSDVSLSVEKGEFVFLVGHTGSGKTTLLRLLTREILPTKGNIVVGGWDIIKLPSHKVAHLRKRIGVIFQDLKLLMERTIWENIMLPLEMSGVNKQDATKRAEELLTQVDILVHKDKFPIQLSGGELQRVAIARALTLSPEILLADEPTGNLDGKTALEIVSLLQDINSKGTTIIMATHNMDIVKKLSKRVVVLDKGMIIMDEKGQKKAEETKEKKDSASAKSSAGKEEKKKEKEK